MILAILIDLGGNYMFGSGHLSFDPEDLGYLALYISIKYKKSSTKSLKLVRETNNICKLYEYVQNIK